MSKHLACLIIILTTAVSAFGQNIPTPDSVFIYKNFTKHGTTAWINYYHRQLDSANAAKEKMNSADLIVLDHILKTAKSKRSFQHKYGGHICYAIMYEKGKKQNFIMWTGSETGGVENLNEMRRWITVDPEQIKYLRELLAKYWP